MLVRLKLDHAVLPRSIVVLDHDRGRRPASDQDGWDRFVNLPGADTIALHEVDGTIHEYPLL
jgi:hypothetical protein